MKTRTLERISALGELPYLRDKNISGEIKLLTYTDELLKFLIWLMSDIIKVWG